MSTENAEGVVNLHIEVTIKDIAVLIGDDQAMTRRQGCNLAGYYYVLYFICINPNNSIMKYLRVIAEMRGEIVRDRSMYTSDIGDLENNAVSQAKIADNIGIKEFQSRTRGENVYTLDKQELRLLLPILFRLITEGNEADQSIAILFAGEISNRVHILRQHKFVNEFIQGIATLVPNELPISRKMYKHNWDGLAIKLQKALNSLFIE